MAQITQEEELLQNRYRFSGLRYQLQGPSDRVRSNYVPMSVGKFGYPVLDAPLPTSEDTTITTKMIPLLKIK